MVQDYNSLNRKLFGKNFIWGISTAAFQTEGSCDIDGKGPSIWDDFTARKGKIKGSHTANVACDFYNGYQRDISLLRKLHIPNFRFSLAWSRIMPDGKAALNHRGIDFYNRVIDHCLENDIQPWLTIYHWDLPLALERKGGWTNRDIVEWFADYVEVCARHFGDRVSNWIVMNEPMVFTGAGYFIGVHAPGKLGLRNFLPSIHHATLAMAAGGRRLRSLLSEAEIGTTFSCSHIEPFSEKRQDVDAARRADALLNRLFIEPTLGLGYPIEDVPVLKNLQRFFRPEDEKNMKFDFDFIGLQNYTREIVRHSYFVPYIKAKLVTAAKRKVPLTDMGWEVYPRAMYEVIKKFNAYSGIRKIYITENGAAFPDKVINGKVEDMRRLLYLKDNMSEVLRARGEGCRVEGYFVWTLTDNFEWAEGYHPRFGLIYVDFQSQQRIIKASGKWYSAFLRGAL